METEYNDETKEINGIVGSFFSEMLLAPFIILLLASSDFKANKRRPLKAFSEHLQQPK